MWASLKNIALNERGQTQRAACCYDSTPRSGGKCFVGIGISLGAGENVLVLDTGSGCIALRMCRTPLNCMV